MKPYLSKSFHNLMSIISKSSNKDEDNNKKCKKILDKPTKSQSKSTINKIKPPALINIGTNCYLNAALQSISSCDKFIEDIEALHNNYKKLEKLTVFYKLINALHSGSTNCMEISRNPIFRNWNKPGQQDSFELLSYLLNQIYNEIKKHKEDIGEIQKRSMSQWLEVDLPMRILIEYEIKCKCLSTVIIPVQSDLALHVSILVQGDITLEKLIDNYFKSDLITDYVCDTKSCSGENAERKIRLIKPLPRTLCIHLQKSYWNGIKLIKLKNKIKFTKELIIKSEYCVDKNMEKENKLKVNLNSDSLKSISLLDSINNSHNKLNYDKLENPPTIIINNKISLESGFDDVKRSSNDKTNDKLDEHYQLCSVIVHLGSIAGGHYVCYKCVKNEWYLTNDYRIKSIKLETIFNSDAYMLIYEKTEK